MREALTQTAFDNGIEKAYDRWYGGYVGVVVDVKDPEGLGRILVRVASVAGNETLPKWAYPQWFGTGAGHGLFWPPYAGDPVTVDFEFGDTRFPGYRGGWFANQDGKRDVPDEFAPEKGKEPMRRGFKTKIGQLVLFDETPGEETVQVVWSNADGSKKSVITFDKSGGIALVGSSGRRLQFDEENGQLFYGDIGADGESTCNLVGSLAEGWTITAADGGTVQATVTIGKDGTIQLMANGQVTLSAPAVSLESSGVHVGGSKAMSQQVLGTELVALLTKLIAQMALLTVGTATGPSTPPINAGAISALAGDLVKCLSAGHTVGP